MDWSFSGRFSFAHLDLTIVTPTHHPPDLDGQGRAVTCGVSTECVGGHLYLPRRPQGCVGGGGRAAIVLGRAMAQPLSRPTLRTASTSSTPSPADAASPRNVVGLAEAPSVRCWSCKTSKVRYDVLTWPRTHLDGKGEKGMKGMGTRVQS